MIGLLLNSVEEWCIVYSYFWKSVDFGIMFCVEMSNVFQWLVWISSYFKLIFMEHIIGVPYALIISVSNSKYNSKFLYSVRNKSNNNNIEIFDERMMILSGVRIYSHLVYLFCRPTYTIMELFFNLQVFQKNIFQRKWYEHYQNMPPWSKVRSYIYSLVMLVVVILSVFLMVLENFWSNLKHRYHQKLYNFRYGNFYDCMAFEDDDLYYFDCITYPEKHFDDDDLYYFDCLPLDVPIKQKVKVKEPVLKYCAPCTVQKFNIKLPMFRQALLIALQNDSNKNAYVSIDPDTEHCVVDNCVNVHI